MVILMAPLKNSQIASIFQLCWQAFGKYKLQILILTIFGFLGGILGGIGISGIIPLFSFLVGNEGGEENIISIWIKKIFLFLHLNFTLKNLIIFIVFLFFLKLLVLILFSFVSVRITSGYEEETRKRLFKNILQANWPYLLKQKLGHLETVLMKNVEMSRNFLGLISAIISTFTSLIAYTLVAINISLPITLITLCLGGVIFFVLKPIQAKVRDISIESEEISRETAHLINENVLGLKTLKSAAVENKVANIGGDFFQKIRNINIKCYLLSTFSSGLSEFLGVILIVGVFAFFYKTSPVFNIAILMTVIYLVKQVFGYLSEFQGELMGINANLPYLKSILNYEKEAIREKERDVGKEPFKFEKELEFKNVCFSYNPGKEVLSNVSFKIKKGEMVGLIGPSGAGKTTVVDLILRLLIADKGQILLDGRDISKISLEEWRKNIGYISQDIFLMNDTIANNIRFYNNSITQKEIEKAAKMADIYDFIQSCPKKFSTIVGERGIFLSGGERQRIVIARILASKAKLLILDEATSALDSESEKRIQKVIKNLKGKITVFAIAHRLSTLIDFDRLLVLKDGKIIEEGPSFELLKNKGSYFAKVYNLKL